MARIIDAPIRDFDNLESCRINGAGLSSGAAGTGRKHPGRVMVGKSLQSGVRPGQADLRSGRGGR
jgi:hypothetical protein